MTGLKAWASNNWGFVNNINPNVTITLYGSNTAPTGPTDGTSLGSVGPTTDANSLNLVKLTGLTTTTAYRYHWLAISHDGTVQSVFCAEAEFYEGGEAVDMTLVSNATTALAQPDDAFIVLWQEDIDTVTPNTDLKAHVSRDGGATWTQATLAEEAVLSTGRILTGTADISGQPAGTSMKYKIETLNTKGQRLHGVGLQWS